MPHVYVSIESDEDAEFNRTTAMFKLDMRRCENEGKSLLDTLQVQKGRLEMVEADEEVQIADMLVCMHTCCDEVLYVSRWTPS